MVCWVDEGKSCSRSLGLSMQEELWAAAGAIKVSIVSFGDLRGVLRKDFNAPRAHILGQRQGWKEYVPTLPARQPGALGIVLASKNKYNCMICRHVNSDRPKHIKGGHSIPPGRILVDCFGQSGRVCSLWFLEDRTRRRRRGNRLPTTRCCDRCCWGPRRSRA